jgi:hypothetical protein
MERVEIDPANNDPGNSPWPNCDQMGSTYVDPKVSKTILWPTETHPRELLLDPPEETHGFPLD